MGTSQRTNIYDLFTLICPDDLLLFTDNLPNFASFVTQSGLCHLHHGLGTCDS